VINQQCVKDAADFDSWLPLAAVARKPRDFSRSHGSDFAQADVGNHTFKASAFNHRGGSTTLILINDLDLIPPKLHQTLTHRILQAPTLFVVSHLIRGGLTHIEDSFTFKMVGLDLLTDRAPPFSERSGERREPRARVASEVPGPSAALREVGSARLAWQQADGID